MSQMPEKVKLYEKRFGAIAIEKGYITIDELISALAIQVREESGDGSHRLIGEILLEQNILTGPQVEEVVSDAIRDKAGQ